MFKRSKTATPETRTKHAEPERGSVDWVIWAAWADRVTFEEIHSETGLTEAEVIRLMRQHQTLSTFKRWRKRVTDRGTKHRRKFGITRRQSDWRHDDIDGI